MKRNKLQIEIKDFLDKSNINKENKTNFILVNHSKNKSVDLKHFFKTDLINKDSKINNCTNMKKFNKKNVKKTNIKEDIRNINLLSKHNSVSNFLNSKNKKKYFFDENFFNKKNPKSKLNISYKKHLNIKKPDNPKGENNVIDNSESRNTNRNKRIIKINRNFIIKEQLLISKKNKAEINNIKIHDILYDNKKEGSKNEKKNNSNLIYIKSKIKGIPYRNKICSTARVNWSQKDQNIKSNHINRNINNLIEDSLDSHNTVVDENNINQYKYFQQNLSYQNINKSDNENDKSFKRIIPRNKNSMNEYLK